MVHSQQTNNTLQIVNTVLVAGVLLLGLTGAFAGNAKDAATKEEVKTIVADAMKAAPAAQPAAAQPQAQQPQPSAVAASKDDILAFIDTAYVDGASDADVTILEFSDFQCPYCKRFSTAKTLETVLTKYEGKVNKIFAHFPLSFHPLAQKAAEGAECVGEQAGAEAFYSFGEKLFAETTPDKDTILKVAATIDGVDAKKVESCMDEGKFAQKVKDQMAFGAKLGVTGTPGSIVFNHKTGETQKVSGAVPAEAFDAPLSAMTQ